MCSCDAGRNVEKYSKVNRCSNIVNWEKFKNMKFDCLCLYLKKRKTNNNKIQIYIKKCNLKK